jgi:uncharacterized protein (TIGR03083 family)
MVTMEIAGHINALERDGIALAEAAARAGLNALVPPCAPWMVRDLLRHTGYIHRWAARHITERPAKVIDGPTEAEILAGGAPDAELIDWFADGHRALVTTLRSADPEELTTATFLRAPSPLAFWARRQAHETAIHRADAQIAAGQSPAYESGFAADGIDELICGFGGRRRHTSQEMAGCSLLFLSADTGDAWRVTGGHPQRSDDDQGTADCTVRGPASGLYLFLWHREEAGPAGIAVSGDPDVLKAWNEGVRVRWG